MIKSSLPILLKDVVLHDAIQRDVTTARRFALLEILWHERYLTRSQLIARVELRLGKNCFGISAWQDTFYRDMRFVKQAFEAAGYQLLYSRNKQQPGYYLDGQPALSAEIKHVLKTSARSTFTASCLMQSASTKGAPSAIQLARWRPIRHSEDS